MGSLTVYMYHDICDFDGLPFPKRYLQPSFLRVSTFLGQLDFIKKHHVIVSLSELLAIKEDFDNTNYAILTFDDGLSNHFTVSQILKNMDLPGAFFLPVQPILSRQMMDTHKIQFIIAEGNHEAIIKDIASFIDDFVDAYNKYSVSLWKNNYWTPSQIFITRILREYPDRQKRKELCFFLFEKYVTKDRSIFSDFYLTIEQIKEMTNVAGMDIGGHGYYSENLLTFSRVDQFAELQTTTVFLRAMCAKKLYLSYPNGGVNNDIIQDAKQLNYKICFATGNRIIHNLNNEDLLCLPRIDAAQQLVFS